MSKRQASKKPVNLEAYIEHLRSLCGVSNEESKTEDCNPDSEQADEENTDN